MAQLSRVARSPDGSDYEIVVEPAPRLGLMAGPWRWWNTLTRSRAWWVTVSGDRWAWPLVRERFASEPEAERRGEQLARAIADGDVHLAGPAWRRQQP